MLRARVVASFYQYNFFNSLKNEIAQACCLLAIARLKAEDKFIDKIGTKIKNHYLWIKAQPTVDQ
jgi:hypothetical protein